MSRVLLGRLGKDGSDTADAGKNVPASTGSTMGLRIAAVFIILSAGLLGGVPPLFIKALRNQNSLPTFLIRAFSAGIILALALVHILPEAVEELVDLGGVDYPLGGTSVLVGLFIMVFIEHAAHLMYDMPHAHAHAPSSDGASGGGGASGDSHCHSHAQGHRHSHGVLSASGFRASIWEPSLTSIATVTAEWAGDGEERRKLPAAAMVPTGPAATAEEGRSHVRPSAVCTRHQASEQHIGHHTRQQLAQHQQQLLGHEQHQVRCSTEQVRLQAVHVSATTCTATPPPTGLLSPTTPSVMLLLADRDRKKEEAKEQEENEEKGTSSWSCRWWRGRCHQQDSGLTAIAAAAIAAADKSSSSVSAVVPEEAPDLASTATATAPFASGAATAPAEPSSSLSSRWTLALREPSADHCHDCVSRASAPNWVSAVEAISSETSSPLRRRVVAYLFELGCIFHSFIIGLSLGVDRTSISQVRALLIALTFHQALEGLSLASVINRGDFSRTRAAVMVAMYGVTCPLGVAIGIAIAASYDPSSLRARAAQGCLNGVSGGMLLYISLVQLVAEDMGKYLLGSPPAAATVADGSGDGDGGAAAATAAAAPPSPAPRKPRGSGLPCSHGGDGAGGRGGHHFHGGDHSAIAGGGAGGRIGCRIRGPSFLAFCLGAASMCLLAVWA